jgi:hypothetical protein
VLCTLQGKWLPIYAILYYIVVYRWCVSTKKNIRSHNYIQNTIVKGSSDVTVFYINHWLCRYNQHKYNFHQTQSFIFLLTLHVSVSYWSSSDVSIRKDFCLETSGDDQFLIETCSVEKVIKGCVWWKLYLFIPIK